MLIVSNDCADRLAAGHEFAIDDRGTLRNFFIGPLRRYFRASGLSANYRQVGRSNIISSRRPGCPWDVVHQGVDNVSHWHRTADFRPAAFPFAIWGIAVVVAHADTCIIRLA